MIHDGVDLRALIRTIADFPQPGVQFRDITTLILDAGGLRRSVDLMVEKARPLNPTVICAIEARGFIFGSAVAYELGLGLVPVRKSKKLPGAVIGIDYALEYGQDRLEIHEGVIGPEDRVLIIDDLIATGGTAVATVDLIRLAGGSVVGAHFIVDLPELGGAERLRAKNVTVETLLAFD